MEFEYSRWKREYSLDASASHRLIGYEGADKADSGRSWFILAAGAWPLSKAQGDAPTLPQAGRSRAESQKKPPKRIHDVATLGVYGGDRAGHERSHSALLPPSAAPMLPLAALIMPINFESLIRRVIAYQH